MWKTKRLFSKNRIAKPRLSCFCLPYVEGVLSFLKTTLLVVQKGGFEGGFPSI